MKLKSLYIQKFKNLIDFSIDFQSENGFTMLIGNNGSGKSNVLEVISGIFHDLFKDKPERKITNDYTLEYVLDDINCKIEQKDGTLRCYGDKYKSRDSFIAQNAPNNIIGLYSGEENRLWTQFYESYYKAFLSRIKTHRHQERMRLMLINKYYWNISLLTLLLSRNETLRPFLNDELKINSVSKIILDFNFKHFESVNELLKAFISRINPEHKSKIEYSIDSLRNAIFYSILTDENGNVLVDTDGTELFVENGTNDIEVFRWFTQAYMPKREKVISNIRICLTDDITVEQLSEGEKKLILVKTVLEILADEKTLLLMDEPDAHLHESRKPVLCEMMREYPNRQIIIATHSPLMVQLAQENELLMLDNDNGKSVIFSEEKIQKIRRLSDRTLDVIGQGLMLKSMRPLIVFEGKTDVAYVKHALDKLKSTDARYREIKVDFISGGGADNIEFFIKDLLSMISSSKKIIVFFDRDNQGKQGAAAITGLSMDDDRITTYTDIQKDNMVVSFIPYRAGVTNGDFLIEDYFLWEPTVKKLVVQEISSKHQPFKQLPNLSKQIKKLLGERYTEFSEEEYAGFVTLLDKIYTLSKEE